ncbi:hypothetical protein PC120_g19644 [Phytophthora cactorum]|nr:hypothetical protein PC120_g19644 [Phytophthora cactorum]
MNRDDAINFIKYVRKEFYGGDEYRVIESEPTVYRRQPSASSSSSTCSTSITARDNASSGKDECTYWHSFHWVRVLGKMKMTSGSISCDFESALINAVRDQFTETRVIGCLFHWKQAIRRKMVELRFPANQIVEVMD